MILNFYSIRGHVQWNVQSIGDIISFRIYDSYFHHDVRGHGVGDTLPISMHVDLFFVFFLRFSCRFFPPHLSLSLSFYFPFYWAFISYSCFGLASSLRQAGLLKKDKVTVDFSELNLASFFRHLKASGVLPVCVSGLILWAYKVTVLAHKKKSTLIESMNK